MTGAFERNPKRRKARAHEPPAGAPLGPAPDCFDEAQRARWDEVAGYCPWLEQSDRFQVEAVCRLMVRMRAEFKPTDVGILTTALAKLGMNPVDRTKVVMVRDEKPKKTLLA